jgi:gluconokinase
MIVVMAGVSGSGKSVVGRLLATRLGWAFEDSDALHSASDIAKMHSGVPLSDADRWPWLDTVAAWIDQRIVADESAVVACSALKRSYRDFLREGRPELWIVMLVVDPAVLMMRLAARKGHFFPPKLLTSQLSDLEMPGAPERNYVLVPAAPTPAQTAERVIGRLQLAPGPGQPPSAPRP